MLSREQQTTTWLGPVVILDLLRVIAYGQQFVESEISDNQQFHPIILDSSAKLPSLYDWDDACTTVSCKMPIL
jgi:hypothetical protein